MTIQGVGAETRRDFNEEELGELRRDASTSATLNQARRNAGQRGVDVTVRGDDGTLGDVLDGHGSHVSAGKAAAGLLDAAHIAEGIGMFHVGGHGMVSGMTAGVVAMAVAVPVGTLVASQVALAELQNTKDDTRDAATRDVLHAGMLLSLELPKDFVARELDKLGVGTTGRAPAKKVSDQLTCTPLGVTLQHHCDRGVHAAQDFLAFGRTKDAFFAAHPNLAERYASDAAFHAGFDSYVWAVSQSPTDAKAMDEGLKARDARYQSAAVPVRA